MQIINLKGFLLLSLISTLMISCQQIEGQSLLSSESTEDTTHDVDKTAKIEELYLAPHAVTINSTGKGKVDVSGDCFTSTYPSNRIVVKRDDGVAIAVVDYNLATALSANAASCKNGRFNFAIQTGNLVAGSYDMRIILEAFDGKSKDPITNTTQGESPLKITR